MHEPLGPSHLAVLDEMLARRTPSPGPHPCRSRLGLVVEGGAMRGVVSMAYLRALQQSGMANVFDVIFAESAGAVNAAYFLAGQTDIGLQLYLRAADMPPITRGWRLASRLDLDLVFAPIISGELALDCEKLSSNPARVQVSLTDAEEGTALSVPLAGQSERIHLILKATTAIVPYCDRYLDLDGTSVVDGGIADPIPVWRAVEKGCTHILVLLTRPEDYSPRPLALWERSLTRLLLARWPSRFRRTFFQLRPERYYQSRKLALGLVAGDPAVHVAAVSPPASLGRIKKFGNDPALIRSVAEQCVAQMAALIHSHPCPARVGVTDVGSSALP